jgi:hypothetical protein
VGTGVAVAVLPMVGLGPGVWVASTVAGSVGGSGVWVGTAADKARVGRVFWALLTAEFCQKKMPILTKTSKTIMIKAIRKTGRDEFTVIPIQVIVFRQKGVQCE